MKLLTLLLATLLPLPLLAQPTLGLQEAIDALENSPTVAMEALGKLDYPTAKAFRAYGMFVQEGPSTQVDKLMNAAIDGVTDDYGLGEIERAKQPYRYDSLSLLLTHLRFVAGTEESGQVVIPCFLLQRHPKEAYQAFAAYWGSTRDSFPLVCREDLSDAPKELQELDAFMKKHRAYDREEQGTMYYSLIASQHLLYVKAVLTPELSLQEVGLEPMTLDEAVKELPKAPRWLPELKKKLNRAAEALHAIQVKQRFEGALLQNTKADLETYVANAVAYAVPVK